MISARSNGKVRTHTKVKVRFPGKLTFVNRDGEIELENGVVQTTVGRILFNDILHPEMKYYNVEMSKKTLSKVIIDCHKQLGSGVDDQSFLTTMKEIGFRRKRRERVSRSERTT